MKSWIIRDSKEEKMLLERSTSTRGCRTQDVHLATYDFTSMYTTLPLRDLKERLGNLLDSVYQHRLQTSRARILMLKQDGTFEWIAAGRRSETDREMMMSLDKFKSMLNKLVDNTYLKFGGELWHQTVGIPMGTNCAGYIANLYCFTYEIEFLRRTVNEGNYDLAKQLLRVQRYIDDLLCIGIPCFDSIRYLPEGIYPKDSLELNMADEGMRVPYMDIFIRQNRRRGLIASIYDKRLEKKYCNIQVIRYPDPTSVLANKTKYGILTSQMHRFARRCSLRSDFVYNVSLVVHRMQSKGYQKRGIWSYVRRFVQQYGSTLYDRAHTGVWIARFARK